MKRLSFLLLLVCLLSACTRSQSIIESPSEDRIHAYLTVRPFVTNQDTKTGSVLSGFSFSEGDEIGIIPYNLDGSGTEHTSQMPLRMTGETEGDYAEFTSNIGWTLMTNGQYKYIAYYPYTSDYTNSGIPIDFTTQLQTANNSSAHTAAYDVLYSDPVLPVSSSSPLFEMNHLCALAKFVITVPAEYGATEFKRMSIQSNNNIFVRSGSCDLGATVSSGSPSFTPSEHSKQLGMSLNNLSPTENKLTVYMMMYPAELEGKTLTLHLWAAHISRSLSGTVVCNEDQENGYMYTYNVTVDASDVPTFLPDRPAEGEQLNILLVGHSFGVDATEYLPALMVESGIDNVNIGRFFYPNCDLARHYEYYVNETPYTYYYSPAGSTKYIPFYGESNKTLKEVINDTAWDLIVFQQSISIEGAGDYSTYQPYLNDLLDAILTQSALTHDRIPYIGWHMFWGHGSSAYDDQFSAIKTATRQMMDETGIQLIISTGAAVHFCRQRSYIKDAVSYPFIDEIYGDGFHCSRGVGRYLGACTWFETIIKPIYGISVAGNTFRMLEIMSGESDASASRHFYPVDDIKAPILQQCAVEAAATPFPD